MDGCSPPASGCCLRDTFKPAARPAAPGAKRLLDSAEQVQAPRAAKRACVLSHQCSAPDRAGKLLPCSQGSPCFQGASRFLDHTGCEDLAASSAASEPGAVAVSPDTARCSDDSEPDDALLELSDSEEENSHFSYTEEEIQEILADDCTESEPYLTRKSALSQSVSGESAEDESSSCSGVSVVREDARPASEVAEKPGDPLPRACSSVGSERCPGLPKASASLGADPLRPALVTRTLFDLGMQELLSLGPVDPLEDNCLAEAERRGSEATIRDCLEYDRAAGSCVLRDPSEGLMPGGRQSQGVGCLGKAPSASSGVPGFCSGRVERPVRSSDPACGRSTADESSAPVMPSCPSPSSGSGNQELCKARASCFSRKLGSPEEEEGKSREAEPPSNSIKLSDTAVGQMGQEETTSGKKPGKVIPVPQEEEERLKQQTGILEAELEPKKHFCAECARPYEEDSSCCPRNYPRPNKKPTRRYSLTQWVRKDLAKHRYFQSIPDHFQRSPVTTFSNV